METRHSSHLRHLGEASRLEVRVRVRVRVRVQPPVRSGPLTLGSSLHPPQQLEPLLSLLSPSIRVRVRVRVRFMVRGRGRGRSSSRVVLRVRVMLRLRAYWLSLTASAALIAAASLGCISRSLPLP